MTIPSFDEWVASRLDVLREEYARQFPTCRCGAVFFRVRQQRYCSERCSKRFYMREFRAAKAAEGGAD